MKIIDCLESLLRSDLFIERNVDSAFLTDTDLLSTCNRIRVISKHNFSVIKVDELISKKNFDIYPFFNDMKAVKRCCDYIIFYHRDNKNYIFLCELKSQSPSGHETQLDGGYLFSKLIAETLKRIERANFDIVFKGILFSTRVTKKYKNYGAKITTHLGLSYLERDCGYDFDLDRHCFN